jgi:hypothetical protein
MEIEPLKTGGSDSKEILNPWNSGFVQFSKILKKWNFPVKVEYPGSCNSSVGWIGQNATLGGEAKAGCSLSPTRKPGRSRAGSSARILYSSK